MFSPCGWLGCALNFRRDAHEQLQQQLSGLQDELKELKRERHERHERHAEQEVAPEPVQPTSPQSDNSGFFAPAPQSVDEKIHTDLASRSVAPNPSPFQAPATETAASERLSKSDPGRHAAVFFGGSLKSGPVRGRSMT